MRPAKCPECHNGTMTVIECRQTIFELCGASLNNGELEVEYGSEIDEGPFGVCEYMCSDCGTSFKDLAEVLGDEEDDTDSESGTSSYRAID